MTWRSTARAGALGAFSLLLAAAAAADVFVLTNGDRVTGKRLGSTRRAFTVQTDYGRLTIPRTRVERIIKEDGTEEVVNELPTGGPLTAPAGMRIARLNLIVVGKSFWLAWNPRTNPGIDPTLRLEVRLDGQPVATYVDGRQDPRDLPGATVNTFSFLAEDVDIDGLRGARPAPPEVKPGRASLRIDVPVARTAGEQRLQLAYQFNAGSADEPAWRDVASAETTVDLSGSGPVFISVRQDPGRMEYSGFPRRRMRRIETFVMELSPGA